jgi:hypothetical protein
MTELMQTQRQTIESFTTNLNQLIQRNQSLETQQQQQIQEIQALKATTAEIDRADEPRLEPDQGIHPQAGEPLEPDSGQPQQSANQHEDVLNHANDGDRPNESIGDGISGTIPERSIQPNAGADQWEGERSSDSDEQVPEASQAEDPQV